MSDEIKTVLFTGIPVLQDVVLILLFIRGMTVKRKRKEERQARLVSLSPMLLWVGAIGGGLLSVPLTLSGRQDPEPALIVFEAGVLGCIAMMLAYCNETVTYDRATFTVSDLFGRKRTWDYGEITGLSRRGGDVVLRCGRRRIRLDAMAAGIEQFLKYADEGYFRRRNKYIPLIPRRTDPMKGNLDTPWLYLFIYLFMFAGGVVFILLSAGTIRPPDGRVPADAAVIRTPFESWEKTGKHDGTLALRAADYDKPFTLSWLSGYAVPVPDPDALCSGEEYVLTVRELKQEYDIRGLSTHDGQPLITAYDRNAAYRRSQLPAVIFLLIFAFVEMAFAVFGILVGRHPEKYPARFRGMFYRDTAWLKDFSRSGKEKRNAASPGRDRPRTDTGRDRRR